MRVILTFDLRQLHNPIPILGMLLPKSDIPETGVVCSQPRSGSSPRENNVLVYVCVCVRACVRARAFMRVLEYMASTRLDKTKVKMSFS